jgi:predicted short-subunit dehydrogenase-like oxidoreductase (DUF2520 family)
VSERVFILGAGRAGRGLARALRASGVDVAGLHGRRADAAEGVTAGALPPALAGAGAILVTVRDAQLEQALAELADASLGASAVVLHASGSADPAGLARLRGAGHPAGTFHPLVPLSDPARAAAVLRGAWIGVDGDPRAVETARRLAAALGAHALHIPAGEKPRYHAAAVFASNFPNVLAALAQQLLRDAGVSAEDGWRAVLTLMAAAVANLQGHQPWDALTGPIVRGDVGTLRRHLDALAGDPAAMAAYRALSVAALPLAQQAGTEARLLEEIADLLAGIRSPPVTHPAGRTPARPAEA